VTGIFISYRREHTAFIVGRLHERLATHFGAGEIVRDIENNDPYADFGQRLDKVVASSAAFLAIVSDRWLVDRNPAGKRPIGVPRDWVQREVETALRRPDVLVIPVLVEGAIMPGEHEMPYSIRSLVMHNPMRLSDAAWDDQVDQLIVALEQVVEPRAGRSAAARPAEGWALPAAPVEAEPPAAAPSRRWFRRH
jgi:hypothetical protein